MPDPVRVALVTHTSRLGGAEWSLLRLAEYLDPDAVRLTVLLGEEGPLADRLRELELDVEVLELDPALRDRRKETLTSAGLADMSLAGPLASAIRDRVRALRARRIEVVHTNSLKANFFGGVAGRLAGAKVLWHIRDHIASPYLPPAAVRAVRLAAKAIPHRVVAVSASAAATVGRRDVIVVHQGVPHVAAGRPGPQGRLRVGLVGRVAPWKGQDVFLAAAERLASSCPDVDFVVAGAPLFGEDEFERSLHRRAESPALAGRVSFLGFCDDVWDVYRGLDVAVHASTLPEPYGNVILEAMASRTPVVAADAGGAREIVRHGRTGLLVKPGDPEALAAALEGLLRDPDERRRLGDAGRAEARDRFSLGADAAVFTHLYRSLAR